MLLCETHGKNYMVFVPPVLNDLDIGVSINFLNPQTFALKMK